MGLKDEQIQAQVKSIRPEKWVFESKKHSK